MSIKILHTWVDGRTCTAGCLFCSPLAGLRRPGWEVLRPEELDVTLSRAEEGEFATLCFYGTGLLDLHEDLQEVLRMRVLHARERGRVGPVRISLRSDQVHEEVIAAWLQAGLSQVELQVSSQADRARLWQGAGHHHPDVEKAADLLKKSGLELGLHLHPGGPGSDPLSDSEDLRWALGLAPCRLRLTPVLVIAGTHLYRAWRGHLFQPLTLSQGIEVGHNLLSQADRAGVPVIRFGWQPADLRIDPSEILAGPYHPSLRGLVESHRLLAKVSSLLQGKVGPGQDLLLSVCPDQEHNLRGIQNSNLQQLRYLLRCRSIQVQADAGLTVGELAWSVSTTSVTRGVVHPSNM